MTTTTQPSTRQLVAATLGGSAKSFILDQVVQAAQAGAVSPDKMTEVLQFCDQTWQPSQPVNEWLDEIIPGLSDELTAHLNQEYQQVLTEQGWKSLADILAADKDASL